MYPLVEFLLSRVDVLFCASLFHTLSFMIIVVRSMDEPINSKIKLLCQVWVSSAFVLTSSASAFRGLNTIHEVGTFYVLLTCMCIMVIFLIKEPCIDYNKEKDL
jgi:hypothetical protein